jgi:hypothetical protein
MNRDNNWTKGRGKLGLFKPLLGSWKCETQSEKGPVVCVRVFKPILDNKYIQLKATWQFGSSCYQEQCVFGINSEKQIAFWSFTNDGKQSTGLIAAVSDIHPQAIGFEAQMPAGLARQIYWPDDKGGFNWAVESKNKKGWNRFVEHNYKKN